MSLGYIDWIMKLDLKVLLYCGFVDFVFFIIIGIFDFDCFYN